jgi:hypothetical protein
MDGKGIAYPRRRQNCLQAREIRYPTVEYRDRGVEEGDGMSKAGDGGGEGGEGL